MGDRTYHHGNLRAALLARGWEVVDREGVDALSLPKTQTAMLSSIAWPEGIES